MIEDLTGIAELSNLDRVKSAEYLSKPQGLTFARSLSSDVLEPSSVHGPKSSSSETSAELEDHTQGTNCFNHDTSALESSHY